MSLKINVTCKTIFSRTKLSKDSCGRSVVLDLIFPPLDLYLQSPSFCANWSVSKISDETQKHNKTDKNSDWFLFHSAL